MKIQESSISQRKISNIVKAIWRGRKTVGDLRQSQWELESDLNTSLPRQSILPGEWPMVSCWLLEANLWFLDQKTYRPLKYFDSCFLLDAQGGATTCPKPLGHVAREKLQCCSWKLFILLSQCGCISINKLNMASMPRVILGPWAQLATCSSSLCD